MLVARLSQTIKDIYTNEYIKFTPDERATYDKHSNTLFDMCLESSVQFAKKRNLSKESLVEIQEAIRENIIIESFYAYPEDPQKVMSIARTKISDVAKLLLDNIYDDVDLDKIIEVIETNTGTQIIKNEQDEILRALRFTIKYDSIGKELNGE